MIQPTMAVATVTDTTHERAESARAVLGPRVRAILIDSFLYTFISLVVNNVYGVTHIETFPQITIGGGGYTTAISVPLQGLLLVAYFLVPEAMFGATPGKWWTYLKVVRLDGRPLAWRDVALRNVLRVVDYQPFFYLLGGFVLLNTPGSQRIGDRLAGTTVVHESVARAPGATRTSGRRARWILAWSLAAAVVVTTAFDYFGRPPLVIAGEFNQHLGVLSNLYSYSLGTPTWGPGTVRYPLTGHTATDACTGSIDMRWEFPFGWVDSDAGLACVPS